MNKDRLPRRDGLIIPHTLADQAFDYLSKAILSGQFQVGDRLVERELAEKLGISRAPIREALAELERQGLAYSVVHHGTFVRAWTKRDLWEVAILRARLEELAAQLAVSHLDESDYRFLEQTVDEMAEAEGEGDFDRLIDLDFQFHDRIVDSCQHQRLQQFLHDLRLQVRIFRIVTRPTDHVRYPQQHRAYIEALRQGDLQVVGEMARAHVMDTAESALAALPDDGTLVIPPVS